MVFLAFANISLTLYLIYKVHSYSEISIISQAHGPLVDRVSRQNEELESFKDLIRTECESVDDTQTAIVFIVVAPVVIVVYFVLKCYW